MRLFFEREGERACDRHRTCDGDHGRIETRCHWISHGVAWLSTDRRFPGEPRFLDLAMIGRVEAEFECNGKITRASRYSLGSAALSASQFARAVHAHWGIENRLHWVMVVVIHDDLMRLRTDHGPPTWPPSDTPLSISPAPYPTKPASRSDAKPSHRTVSEPASGSPEPRLGTLAGA